MTGQPTLPGLEPPEPTDGPMVKAAHATMAQLLELRAVEPRHAVQVQLVLSLAAAIDAGTRTGKASSVAMAARELRETMLVLDPPPPDGEPGAEGRDRLAAFMDKLELAAQNHDPVPNE